MIRAMAALSGARGVLAAGQPMEAETVMVRPFLWGVVWPGSDGQAMEPEPDAVHPDQGRDPLGHEGLPDEPAGQGRGRRGLRAAPEGRAERDGIVASQRHGGGDKVRRQGEPQFVGAANVEERGDIEALVRHGGPGLVWPEIPAPMMATDSRRAPAAVPCSWEAEPVAVAGPWPRKSILSAFV